MYNPNLVDFTDCFHHENTTRTNGNIVFIAGEFPSGSELLCIFKLTIPDDNVINLYMTVSNASIADTIQVVYKKNKSKQLNLNDFDLEK